MAPSTPQRHPPTPSTHRNQTRPLNHHEQQKPTPPRNPTPPTPTNPHPRQPHLPTMRKTRTRSRPHHPNKPRRHPQPTKPPRPMPRMPPNQNHPRNPHRQNQKEKTPPPPTTTTPRTHITKLQQPTPNVAPTHTPTIMRFAYKSPNERKNNNDCRHRNHRTRRSTQRHLHQLGRPRTSKPLHPQTAIPHPRRTQRIQPQHPRLLKHKTKTTPETWYSRGFTHTLTWG